MRPVEFPSVEVESSSAYVPLATWMVSPTATYEEKKGFPFDLVVLRDAFSFQSTQSLREISSISLLVLPGPRLPVWY